MWIRQPDGAEAKSPPANTNSLATLTRLHRSLRSQHQQHSRAHCVRFPPERKPLSRFTFDVNAMFSCARSWCTGGCHAGRVPHQARGPQRPGPRRNDHGIVYGKSYSSKCVHSGIPGDCRLRRLVPSGLCGRYLTSLCKMRPAGISVLYQSADRVGGPLTVSGEDAKWVTKTVIR